MALTKLATRWWFSTISIVALGLFWVAIFILGGVRLTPGWKIGDDRSVFLGHAIAGGILTAAALILTLYYGWSSRVRTLPIATTLWFYRLAIIVTYLTSLGFGWNYDDKYRGVDPYDTTSSDSYIVLGYYNNWNQCLFVTSMISLVSSGAILNCLVDFKKSTKASSV